MPNCYMTHVNAATGPRMLCFALVANPLCFDHMQYCSIDLWRFPFGRLLSCLAWPGFDQQGGWLNKKSNSLCYSYIVAWCCVVSECRLHDGTSVWSDGQVGTVRGSSWPQWFCDGNGCGRIFWRPANESYKRQVYIPHHRCYYYYNMLIYFVYTICIFMFYAIF